MTPRIPNRVMRQAASLGDVLDFAMHDHLRRHVSLFHRLPHGVLVRRITRDCPEPSFGGSRKNSSIVRSSRRPFGALGKHAPRKRDKLVQIAQIAEQNPILIFKPGVGGQPVSRILANAYLQSDVKAPATEQQVADQRLRQTVELPSRQGPTDPLYGPDNALGFPRRRGLHRHAGKASEPPAQPVERDQIKPGFHAQQPKRRAGIKPFLSRWKRNEPAQFSQSNLALLAVRKPSSCRVSDRSFITKIVPRPKRALWPKIAPNCRLIRHLKPTRSVM